MGSKDSFDLKPFPPLKIAFTYDSIADRMKDGFPEEQCLEFQAEDTIDAIASALRKLGDVEMIGGLKALTHRLTNSRPDWDVVFNFCEGHGTIGREAQVPALLEAWDIPFTLSDSATMALCLDKAKTKMILDHFKIPTAPFALIPARESWSKSGYNPLDAIEDSVHAPALATFPLFVKPASLSTGIGISPSNKVADREELLRAIESISKQYPQDTLLVERYLPGKEFTVGILGTGEDAQVIGVRELVFQKNGGSPSPDGVDEEIYGYTVKMNWEYKCPNPWLKDLDPNDTVAKAVAEVALRAWRVLGCRDAGRIDIRHDSKNPFSATPNFIEVNTIAGMMPGPNGSDIVLLAEANGIGYDKLVALIVDKALRRYR